MIIPEDQIGIVKVFGESLFGLVGDRIFSKLRTDGIHERVETALVPQFVAYGSTVLDVGANIGYYSAWLRHCVGNQGIVHAFEANPATASLIRRSISHNDWQNVVLKEAGVSDSVGTLRISYNEDFLSERDLENYNLGNWSLLHREAGNLEIPTITIDDYVEETALTRISFVKIDVEGYEKKVLRGAKRTIAKFKPTLLVELLAEVAQDHSQNTWIIDFITQAGYDIFRTSSRPISRLVKFEPQCMEQVPYHFYIFCVHRRIAEVAFPHLL